MAQHDVGEVNLARSLKNVPSKARGLFGECIALCANAVRDADEEVRVRAKTQYRAR